MHLAVLSLVIDKILNNPALYQMLGYDDIHVFGLYTGVKSAFGIYNDDRAPFAKSKAARAHYLYLFAQTIFFYKLLKALYNLERVGGGAARSAANQHM